jgi:hypothetical protein
VQALFVLFLSLICSLPALAQEGQTGTVPALGYLDEDRDGRNDLFIDENGDGVNDLTGQPYPHRFSFVDEDGDGRNDLFIDFDGDGVNDLEGRFADRDGDGACDNVIDFDGDGVNDITGEKYSPHALGGYRFGLIFEEQRRRLPRFVDEDGDGMHDRLERFHRRALLLERQIDLFIDEDGDGIDDHRRMRRPPPGLPMRQRLEKGDRPPPPRRPMPGRLHPDEEERRQGRKGGRR